MLLDRFDRQTLRGFIHPFTGFQPEGVELLAPDGSLAVIPYPQIKLLSFVRDLEGTTALAERRQFLARPKAAGLWARFHFRDGETMEGVLPNDLLLLAGPGFTFVPPDVSRNTQRVFVPRDALDSLTVLGVVGSPLRERRAPQRGVEPRQIRLFSDQTG